MNIPPIRGTVPIIEEPATKTNNKPAQDNITQAATEKDKVYSLF